MAKAPNGRRLSNQINRVLERWLKPPGDLAPAVDCERCTLSLTSPQFSSRWQAFKCCAFQPYVANFYCGAMLEAGTSPLPADMAKAMLQPLGVMPTAPFRKTIDETPDEQRGETHLCTYYDRQARRCGIWEFRPGECSLYYCGSDVKRDEREQWSSRAFQFESAMAQMALAHLGFSPNAIAEQVLRLNQPDVECDVLKPSAALEIYRASWNWAKTQSESDVQSWLSFDNPQGGG